MFSDLVEDDGDAVQANQFLLIDHGQGALIDPGGHMTFNELTLTLRKYIAMQDLHYLLASHADPNIIASLDRWMTASKADLVISRLWARFAPHFCKLGKADVGGTLRLGKSDIVLLQAHFLHAEESVGLGARMAKNGDGDALWRRICRPIAVRYGAKSRWRSAPQRHFAARHPQALQAPRA